MKSNSELVHLRQVCRLGLPGTAVVPAVLRSLRQLVPCDSAAYFWVDQRCDMVNMYAERLLAPELRRRYFERHYGAEEHGFRDRLQRRVARAEWVAETDWTAAPACAYHQEILRPLAADRILHGIVRDEVRPIGQVSLYRSADAPRFTNDDWGALAAALRYLGQALANDGATGVLTPAANDSSFRDSGDEAVAVCAPTGTIETASPRAYALLTHAAGESLGGNALDGAADRAISALICKVAQRMHGEDCEPDGRHEFVTGNAFGRYRLRAFPLSDGRFTVVVRRQEHVLIRLADAMRGLPLSAQQREVALLLAQGLNHREIAWRLRVSVNTADYHIKQLFNKLDAHDRGEVVARILAGHTVRRS